MTRPLPLDGVRVLELGSFIAAPTAGRQLADFGADVVKIERPGVGDELRTWRLHAGSTSMLYRTINRNKRSATIDLRSDEGRDLVRELAANTDVVVENFRPGRLEAWGLGPEDLTAGNAELVMARISAFGQTGPKSVLPGFGAIAEALGGMRELTGEPGRPPVRVGISIGDTLAGMHAAFGILLALRERDLRRHAGLPPLPLADRIVDVALTESVLSVMESLLPDAGAYGVQRERLGGWTQGIAPSNAYLCADGRSVVIAGNGDGIFLRLMELIERPELGAREDLSSNALRWTARLELDEAIGIWTATLPAAEVVARCDATGVPASLIYTADDIAADEQFIARGMVQRMRVSTGEEDLDDVPFPGVVPRVGTDPGTINHLGPDLGVHTDEVVREWLGCSEPDAPPDAAERREAVR
jgi:formyl-CoA transferase